MIGLLFIDDEEGVRRSIIRALKREPYKTHTVENGNDGITFIRENLSDVEIVISDYKMPGLDGLETLAVIGSLNPEITRIILTGYATMEAAIGATNEGIDGFLTKPFDNVELRAKIHEILVRKHLKQFVPEQIYQKIIQSSGSLKPTFQEATILFCDIRDYTHMSQGVLPETIATFLNNSFFTPMGEIAYQFSGTVDKHMGDSIMVVFGAPVSRDDDALRAVHAAIEMQKKAEEINETLINRNGLRLRIGISISTGEVFSGILGSRRKKEYTSIGPCVNIASRLQQFAHEGEILITDTTYQKTYGQIPTSALPSVHVKGINDPVQIYRVNWS